MAWAIINFNIQIYLKIETKQILYCIYVLSKRTEDMTSNAQMIENYNAAFHAIVVGKNWIGRNIKDVSIFGKEDTSDVNVNEAGNLIILKLTKKTWIEIDEVFLNLCYEEDCESKLVRPRTFSRI